MISAYLDELITAEEIASAANKLALKKIPLRNIEGENIYNLEEEQLKEVFKTLKDNKLKVSLIDITEEYDLYDLLDIEKLIYIENLFAAKTLLLKLPKLTNFDAEKEQLVKVIKDLIDKLKKEKIDLVFHVNYQINSGYIAYLIKKIKELYFSFSPGECYLNEKATNTYYSLLRNRIKNVVLYDVSENKKPALIGYGKARILETIDNLNQDKYKGDIYYDFNLASYVKAKQEPEEKGFFKKLFTRKKRKAQQEIDQKLRLEKDDEIEFIELLSKQLKVINKYQKS